MWPWLWLCPSFAWRRRSINGVGVGGVGGGDDGGSGGDGGVCFFLCEVAAALVVVSSCWLKYFPARGGEKSGGGPGAHLCSLLDNILEGLMPLLPCLGTRIRYVIGLVGVLTPI